ncbi:hypothetical protein K438DRAFT_2029424 [Mycena galopus ATCC 62051]|nr:hypothetical protein K438DRAFT_2029424 [Mycena galopus ATCC 62051]
MTRSSVALRARSAAPGRASMCPFADANNATENPARKVTVVPSVMIAWFSQNRAHQTELNIGYRFLEESKLKSAALQLQIDALVELRDHEHACAAALKYIICRFRTLPIELVAKIFELTIHEDTHINGRVSNIADADSLSLLMPWTQLTDLTLIVHVPEDAIDVLAQCANLITASVTTPGWNELDTSTTRNTLALTRLHALSVTFPGAAEHITLFFDCMISAPVLQELCVKPQTGGFGVWAEASFTAFQLRGPNITHLKLINSDLTSDDLRAILRNTPSITYLKLYGCNHCFDNALVSTLYYDNGVTPLVPRMHHLVFEGMPRDLRV